MNIIHGVEGVPAHKDWVPFIPGQSGCILKYIYFTDHRKPDYPANRNLSCYDKFGQIVPVGVFHVWPNCVSFTPRVLTRLRDLHIEIVHEISNITRPYGWFITTAGDRVWKTTEIV